ncbi:MAG: DegV family protein [Clostridia bacterium]|nr:DegV family protein [Clostridia bacterium]
MKRWLELLNDPARDIYERRYRLLSAISIVSLFIWLLVAAAVDFHSKRLLFFLICDVMFVPMMIITLRTGQIQLGAGGSGFLLVFLMLPFAFFYNGGIEAGAPNWSILAMVFVTLTVRGGLRTFLLVSDVLVTALCYVICYYHPELVAQHTVQAAYVDSLASLIITALIVSSMFLFQLHVYGQEREILERQSLQIEELNRAQNSFFSSMSHEIRTPVNTIIGLNEMILRENVSDEVREDALHIESASRMLLQTVNDILEMSRLESGQLEIVNARYATGGMLSDVVNMIRVRAREKGLAFDVDVDPALPAGLYGDEMRIKQVLINLLTNAVKYTEKGGVTLSVQGERAGEGSIRLICTVTDTGIGIRQESIPHLFTAFKRVDEHDNRHIEGTGLGLSIVKQLLDLMGGEISVNSIYTKGTTVIVTLPQAIADDAPVGPLDVNDRRDAGDGARYVPAFTAERARVLAVDDTAANLMVVEKLLRDTRVRVDTARSGAEALERTLQTRYDAILMDHLMPGMDGIECLRRVRAQAGGLCHGCPAVALTANVGSGMEAMYRREGFDGYLVKPIRGEVLERELLRLLPPELVCLTGAAAGDASDVLKTGRARVRRQIAVTVDSSADLPEEALRAWEIAVIPFYVRTKDGLFQDGVEVDTRGLVGRMKRGEEVRAVPPSREELEAFFAEALSGANNVIHFTAGRSVSQGYPVACAAAESFNNVTVYDGGHLSTGTGLLALHAARLARAGKTVDEILSELDRYGRQIVTTFVIDTADYLVRAGRTRRSVKLVSDALLLRPEFQMRRGQLRTARLFMGSRERTRKKYVKGILRRFPPGEGETLYLTHVGLTAAECAKIVAEVRDALGHDRVSVQDASSAISTNCGPGTYGLIYRAGEALDGG